MSFTAEPTSSSNVDLISEDESVLRQLHTRLSLLNELVGQFQTDILARDELVELLTKQLHTLEEEDVKKRELLKAWKLKVLELDNVCQALQEEVDDSKEVTLGILEALRTRVSELIKEKEEWKSQDALYKEKIATLEGLVEGLSTEKNENAVKLTTAQEEGRQKLQAEKEVLHAETHRYKQLGLDRQQEMEEERKRHMIAQKEWEEHRSQLTDQVENLTAEKLSLRREVDRLREGLAASDERVEATRKELEAQRRHVETDAEQMEVSEKHRREIEEERNALRADVDELTRKINTMEVEWTTSENQKLGLEHNAQNLLRAQERLEKDCSEVRILRCLSFNLIRLAYSFKNSFYMNVGMQLLLRRPFKIAKLGWEKSKNDMSSFPRKFCDWRKTFAIETRKLWSSLTLLLSEKHDSTTCVRRILS